MSVVFNGAFDALLVDHVSLGVVRIMAKRFVEHLSLNQKHVCSRTRIIPRIPDVTFAILFKGDLAELK